ncbi:MAG: hypothetical protein P8Y93_14020 [Acidobacteriota bacterium]|jgi:hypothetical protein
MSDEVFVEVELKGSRDQAIGFVEGYRVATRESNVWFCLREHLDHGGLLDALKERMRLETHVILSRDLADRIAKGLEESDLLELEVEETHEVDYVELPFEFKCFSRDDAAEIRARIEKDLPDGVSLEDYEVKEDIDEEAAGVEMYSPVHDFIAAGKGRYVGAVPGVMDICRRIENRDFIHPGRPQLHYVT